MNDEIIAFLRENPAGVSSVEIAGRFLKFKNAEQLLAHKTVSSILSRDRRCFYTADGLWKVIAAAPQVLLQTIKTLPWSAVYIIADPDRSRKRIYHISIWHIFDTVACAFSSWMSDLKGLPYEEREELTGGEEITMEESMNDTLIERICSALGERLPVFFSSYQYNLLNSACSAAGRSFTDDTIIINELLRAADIKVAKPFSLEQLSLALTGSSRVSGSAIKQGETFAECIAVLLETVQQCGVETRADIDASNSPSVRPEFADKEFTIEQVMTLPEDPGIYAFKNKAGEYIYIGKAKNLKRRVLSYFKESDESPEKLERLRKEAYSLTTHNCGSELESLLLEYRLIKKYSPLLNKQYEINERKGTFTPLNDSIILLPHSEEGKGMSFWCKRDQKIIMKSFDSSFADTAGLTNELGTFFLSDNKLPSEKSDFPEQEIVFRWVRQHQNSLVTVPVSRMGSADEICKAMKSYWRELSGAA